MSTTFTRKAASFCLPCGYCVCHCGPWYYPDCCCFNDPRFWGALLSGLAHSFRLRVTFHFSLHSVLEWNLDSIARLSTFIDVQWGLHQACCRNYQTWALWQVNHSLSVFLQQFYYFLLRRHLRSRRFTEPSCGLDPKFATMHLMAEKKWPRHTAFCLTDSFGRFQHYRPYSKVWPRRLQLFLGLPSPWD